MKKVTWAFPLVALFAIGSAFATKKQTYDRKYEITGQGGSGASAYWTLGINVTGQTPNQPGTYRCDPASDPCTAELNASSIFSGNRVLKSAASTPATGHFVDL